MSRRPWRDGALVVTVLAGLFVAPAACGQVPAWIGAFGSSGTGPGQFQFAHGLATGPDGSIYVGVTVNNRVQKFGPDGQFLLQWGVNFPSELDVDLLAVWRAAALDRHRRGSPRNP
jgi:hypothetical protein